MTDEDELRGATLHDTSSGGGLTPREAALIYLGSPEDAFSGAGQAWLMAGLSTVQFGRADDREFRVQRDGDSMRIDIPLAWVSGEHAQLRFAPDQGSRIVDLGSRNGSFVDGAAVQEGVTVGPGEVIEIGRSFWMLRVVRPEQFDGDPGASAHPGHRVLLRSLQRLAPSDVPILLTGETGVGKGHLALWIHRHRGSPGPFVHANVSVRSPEASMFNDARGGTLFLDEVGELTAEAQALLVAALMERDGDARIVAASNRDLRGMVTTGAFRSDLFARLAGYEARLTALRERREDLGLLASSFAIRPDGSAARVSIDLFRDLLNHDWPFNVRELEHTLKAAAALTDPDGPLSRETYDKVRWTAGEIPSPARIQAVRHELVQQLVAHGGNTTEVARSLGCELVDIELWLTRFELEPTQYAS